MNATSDSNGKPLLLYGGGLKMGRVIGQSTRDAAEPLSEPITIPNLIATVLHTRSVPRVTFVFDESVIGALRVDSILKDLRRNAPPAAEADPEAPDEEAEPGQASDADEGDALEADEDKARGPDS